MIDAANLIAKRDAILGEIADLRNELTCAQMIDSTARMQAESQQIRQKIAEAQARLVDIESAIGGEQ